MRRTPSSVLATLPRPAADLFVEEDDGLRLAEDALLFLQLPTSIPGIQPPPQQPQQQQQQQQGDSAADAVDVDAARPSPSAPLPGTDTPFESSFGAVKEGTVGKLVVKKSGRLLLQLGGVEFEIVAGTECGFLQQIVAVDAQDAKAFVLGDVTNRLVCQPIIPQNVARPSS